MNNSLRQELNDKIKNTGIIIWIELSIFNSTETEERQLTTSELTDKEISNLHSDLNWGIESGKIITDDRDATINWLKK